MNSYLSRRATGGRYGAFLVLCAVLLLGGCTVQLVADYDAASFEETLRVGKMVDRFYGDLLETPPGERAYANFSAAYIEIETELRSLLTRNQARPLNAESIAIVEIILRQWTARRDAHKRTGAYADGEARLDRDRFAREFASAARAEAYKESGAAGDSSQ